jgi:DNA polymerase (family 10)
MLEERRARLPAALTELLRIPGLGLKRVKALYRDLGVTTLEALEQAARAGRICALPGFGPKSEEHILRALAARAGTTARYKLALATQYVEALVAYLAATPGVAQVVVTGSYRRAQETIGDLDILVAARHDSRVMDRFVAYGEVREVLAHGSTKSSVVLASGLQVDVRVIGEESYGAALQDFIGSKAHNVVLRHLAQQQGLKLNEYGVFRGDERVAGATEESVYAAVGLPWIPPELRENRGEFDAARRGWLEKGDVLNARPLCELKALLKRTVG